MGIEKLIRKELLSLGYSAAASPEVLEARSKLLPETCQIDAMRILTLFTRVNKALAQYPQFLFTRMTVRKTETIHRRYAGVNMKTNSPVTAANH